MATRLRFAAAMLRVSPPWLRRTIGARVMQALGDPIDDLVDRTVEGVKLRFPGHDLNAIDADALATTGRERRIRRGPSESAATYARRLQTWWDAHATRGGPYALLRQLDAFFEEWLNVRMDVVYQSGTRVWIDTSSVITRDSIVWSTGPLGWAHVWVFFHLPSLVPSDLTITTQAGDTLVTEGSEELIGGAWVSPSVLTDAEKETFRLIPRDWSAAHIPYVNVVLLFGGNRLWGYPQPVPTWGAWGTWQSVNPIQLIAE